MLPPVFALIALVTTEPAFAQHRYAATVATPPRKAMIVTRTTVWRCADGICTADKGGSRDAIMCELLAREVGVLNRFAANGTAFDTDGLAACNARAKPAPK